MPSLKQVKIYNFTDPMMGLSYESEPFFRRLDTHFGRQVALQFVMGGLVRDVADFMTPDDFKDGKERAFQRYNARLAKIYEAEQVISGMPIKMDRLALFDETHTSSLPLNLAFKAVEIISPHLAEPFLYRLRFATIVEQAMTTDERVLADVAVQTGIAKEAFFKAYHSDSVKHALQNDFDLRAKWGIRALPAYLFCYGDKQILKTGVLDFDGFASVIKQISDGQIVPTKPTLNTATLQYFLQKRELVSLTEIRHAFDLADNQAVREWLGKIEQNWRWLDEEFLLQN